MASVHKCKNVLDSHVLYIRMSSRIYAKPVVYVYNVQGILPVLSNKRQMVDGRMEIWCNNISWCIRSTIQCIYAQESYSSVHRIVSSPLCIETSCFVLFYGALAFCSCALPEACYDWFISLWNDCPQCHLELNRSWQNHEAIGTFQWLNDSSTKWKRFR